MGATRQGFKLRYCRRTAVWFGKETAFKTEDLIRADHESAWHFHADRQSLGPGKMKSDVGGIGSRRHERRFDPTFIYRGSANLERYPGGTKKAPASGALGGDNERRRATPKPCHGEAINFNW